jgi:hypothetical protein
MALAFVVAMVAASSLSWRIRRLVRGTAPVTTLELVAVALYTFVLGAGSAFMFLASRAIVYHEPEIWGAALSIAAFDRVLEYLLRPSGRKLFLAGLLTTFACLARFSVGLGAAAALGAVLVGQAVLVRAHRKRLVDDVEASSPNRLVRLVRWLGVEPPASLRRVAATGVAFVSPIVLYAYTNWARFGTLFTVPFSKQVFSSLYPTRRAMLRANGGSLFGIKFVPSTLLQYVRPDALRAQLHFPFVTFPPRAVVVGNVILDARDLTSSVPASMPLFTVLGAVGVVTVVRRIPALRIPLLAALVGVVPTLTIGYVANRYLADFMPFLVLASLAGLHVVLREVPSLPPQRRKAICVAFVVLAGLSVVANFGLAYVYQRNFSPARLLGI